MARSALNFLGIKNIKALEVPTGLKPSSWRSLLTTAKKTAIACERPPEKQVIFRADWTFREDYSILDCICISHLLFLVWSHNLPYFRHLSNNCFLVKLPADWRKSCTFGMPVVKIHRPHVSEYKWVDWSSRKIPTGYPLVYNINFPLFKLCSGRKPILTIRF